MAEEARVQVRNIRREANDQLKKQEKDSEITEDELRANQDEVKKSLIIVSVKLTLV